VASNWIFWGIAAVFVIVALALVLPPLMRRKPAPVKVGRRSINIAVYRDQMKEMEVDRTNGLITDEQFANASSELEARLAQDAVETLDGQLTSKSNKTLGIVLAVLIPVAAVGLYRQIGTPQAVMPQSMMAGQTAGTSPDIQAMLKSAEDKVKANPDDAQTWTMLARAYSVLEKWPDAIRAFENLVRLTPNDASVWSHYGEALALSENRNLEGKPMEMVRKALELDPKEIKALELSGIYAYQHKDYAGAVKNWQQVVELSPPGEEYTKDMQGALDKAKEMAGEGSSKPALDNLSGFSGAASGKDLTGTVSISAKLKNTIASNDAVFVFARASGTGGQPLAVIRLDASTLPAAFKLDDSQAMAPGSALSTQKSVDLVARISKSGNAAPSPGDLEGSLKAVKVGTSGINLVIDHVR
jgi:cytochrome c-type biogenesis protein CcmH